MGNCSRTGGNGGQRGAAPRPTLPAGSLQGLRHLHHHLGVMGSLCPPWGRIQPGICPVKQPRHSPAEAHLGVTGRSAPPSTAAGTEQPRRVIRGTAALISGQNSRITARQGCLESSNMVSVPAASTRCPHRLANRALGTMPERSHRGVTQRRAVLGLPGTGVWERSELGTAERVQPTDTDELPAIQVMQNPATSALCLEIAVCSQQHQILAPNGASPCTAGVSTKRWGSIIQCLICFKSSLFVFSHRGQPNPSPVRHHGPLDPAHPQPAFTRN